MCSASVVSCVVVCMAKACIAAARGDDAAQTHPAAPAPHGRGDSIHAPALPCATIATELKMAFLVSWMTGNTDGGATSSASGDTAEQAVLTSAHDDVDDDVFVDADSVPPGGEGGEGSSEAEHGQDGDVLANTQALGVAPAHGSRVSGAVLASGAAESTSSPDGKTRAYSIPDNVGDEDVDAELEKLADMDMATAELEQAVLASQTDITSGDERQDNDDDGHGTEECTHLPFHLETGNNETATPDGVGASGMEPVESGMLATEAETSEGSTAPARAADTAAAGQGRSGSPDDVTKETPDSTAGLRRCVQRWCTCLCSTRSRLCGCGHGCGVCVCVCARAINV